MSIYSLDNDRGLWTGSLWITIVLTASIHTSQTQAMYGCWRNGRSQVQKSRLSSLYGVLLIIILGPTGCLKQSDYLSRK